MNSFKLRKWALPLALAAQAPTPAPVAPTEEPAVELNPFVVTSTTATRRLAKILLPFEARAESVFEQGRALQGFAGDDF